MASRVTESSGEVPGRGRILTCFVGLVLNRVRNIKQAKCCSNCPTLFPDRDESSVPDLNLTPLRRQGALLHDVHHQGCGDDRGQQVHEGNEEEPGDEKTGEEI